MLQKINTPLYLMVLIAASILSGCSGQEPHASSNAEKALTQISAYERFKDQIDALSLREKVAQTVILNIHPGDLEEEYGSIETYIERYPVGGIFVSKSGDNSLSASAQDRLMKQVIESFSNASPVPILVQQDFEQGLGGYLEGEYQHFPPLMGLGATHKPSYAADLGKAVALEARSAGYNWLLHPIADINLNPHSPIANTRALTDDPDLAIAMLSQQIQGLQINGVAATIKHFPGDGMDFRDQHIVASENNLSKEEWWQVHGKVFQALVDSGVYSIMPGHITLPFYQKEQWRGAYLPATLSKELITDLLKNEMGFEGVVVSDAMIMAGFRAFFTNQMERQIKSFEAGVDMMLWPSNDYVDTLEAYILAGKIPESRLNDAVGRIWAMKHKLGLFGSDEHFRSLTEAEQAFCEATNQRISTACLTSIRQESELLPLSPNTHPKLLLVNLATDDTKSSGKNKRALDHSRELWEAKGFQVDYHQSYPLEGYSMWDEKVVENYDALIFMLSASPHYPMGTLLPEESLARAIWGINSLPKDKLIVVSFGTPYLIPQYLSQVLLSVNAYGNAKGVQKAFVEYLTTGKTLEGKSPVQL